MNRKDFNGVKTVHETIARLVSGIDKNDLRAAEMLYEIARAAIQSLNGRLKANCETTRLLAERSFAWPALVTTKDDFNAALSPIELLNPILGKALPANLKRSWRFDSPASVRTLLILCRVWSWRHNDRRAGPFQIVENALGKEPTEPSLFHPRFEEIRFDLPELDQTTLPQWLPALRDIFEFEYSIDKEGFKKDFESYLKEGKGVKSAIWKEIKRRIEQSLIEIAPRQKKISLSPPQDSD